METPHLPRHPSAYRPTKVQVALETPQAADDQSTQPIHRRTNLREDQPQGDRADASLDVAMTHSSRQLILNASAPTKRRDPKGYRWGRWSPTKKHTKPEASLQKEWNKWSRSDNTRAKCSKKETTCRCTPFRLLIMGLLKLANQNRS